MLIKTIFSGFGGQGIILMGYLLATGGMYEGKNVTCLPSYGAEVRGGTANCTVVISNEEIASPVASEPDYAVIMNTPAMVRFQNQIQTGGIIFINSSLIETRPIRGDLEIIEVPLNELSKQLGGENRATNMIMLGAFIRKTGLVSMETMLQVIKDTFGNRPGVFKLNKTALSIGYNYLE